MKRVIKINASSLPWMTCSLRWYRHVIEGWKEPRVSAAIIYGQALHKFIDTMYKHNGDMALSIAEGEKVFRQPKVEDRKSKHLNDERHWLGVTMDYWMKVVSKSTDQLLMMPTGKPATEVTFEILYYQDDNYEVWLAGTIDKIVKIHNGCYAIGDYKTTSDSKPETKLESYNNSYQLRFYVLSLKLMAEREPESMLGKIGATRVGAFIDGVFIRPERSKCEYHRSKVFMFSDNDLSNYRIMLDRQIRKLLAVLDTGEAPLKEGLFNGACNSSFRCPFFTVCGRDNPELEEAILKQNFIQKTYEPLKHND